MTEKVLSAAIGLTGVFTLIPGLMEIIFSLTGRSFTWVIVTFAGEFVLWRGVILTAAGIIFLFAMNESNPLQKRAQAVLASLMIWIVAGMQILSLILGAIPGEGERWITDLDGLISSCGEPVIPSILLLPVTLILVLLIFKDGGTVEEEK
ncbi:hypothetical protein KGY71_05560 [Candidatus Bipolaricaulota bacterium]|nr:hypothetical protein [Candidatus Bipolaricaulota bacterium]